MLAKGVLNSLISWSSCRKLFYAKLKRRLLEWDVIALVDRVGGFPVKLDDDNLCSASNCEFDACDKLQKESMKRDLNFSDRRPVTPAGFIYSGNSDNHLPIDFDNHKYFIRTNQ